MCLLQSQFRDLLKKIAPQKQVMGPFKELLWWPSHGPAWLLETPQKAPLPFLCLLTIHQWSDIIYEKVTITKLWWGRRSSFPRPIIAPHCLPECLQGRWNRWANELFCARCWVSKFLRCLILDSIPTHPGPLSITWPVGHQTLSPALPHKDHLYLGSFPNWLISAVSPKKHKSAQNYVR